MLKRIAPYLASMFRERTISSKQGGWIEVICGSMFSGKTEELIRRLKRAAIAKLTVEVFKPASDVRYDPMAVVSHDTNRFDSHPVTRATDILALATPGAVIGIDEAQFFDDELPEVVVQLAAKGCRVIIAGLDMDFSGTPFGPMPQLLAIAEYITKLHAICVQCGNLASFSFRKHTTTDTFHLGAGESYEPRCRACYLEG